MVLPQDHLFSPQKPLGQPKPYASYEASKGIENESLLAAFGSHDQYGRHAHIL